jgi:tripartite-type tricarboxylate transporter receptor subunit TctC
MLTPGSRARAGLAAALVACLVSTPAVATDFYAGRTIDFVIGSDVGGGFDVYTRVIARHLARFLPGSPTIVPKNQPGAGSGRAAALLYGVAPKDGSAIAAVFPGAIMGPLLDDRAQALYDPTKFQYLGSADSPTRLCITHGRSKVRSFEDALHQKTIMGASAAGGSTRDYVNMLKRATGAMFELVAGYKGTAEILLAMERGEVDGLCGIDWSSLKTQRPAWIRDGSVNILLQTSLEPDAELTKLGVPPVWPFIAGDDDKKAAALIIGQQVFGRPYLAPPGIAAEPLALLRAGFAATLQDQEFRADAERTRIDVNPSSGERVQRLVEELYATPKAIVERAKELVKP